MHDVLLRTLAINTYYDCLTRLAQRGTVIRALSTSQLDDMEVKDINVLNEHYESILSRIDPS